MMMTIRSLASGPSAGAICGGMGVKECVWPCFGKTSPMWDVPVLGGIPPCRSVPSHLSRDHNWGVAGLRFY